MWSGQPEHGHKHAICHGCTDIREGLKKKTANYPLFVDKHLESFYKNKRLDKTYYQSVVSDM